MEVAQVRELVPLDQRLWLVDHDDGVPRKLVGVEAVHVREIDHKVVVVLRAHEQCQALGRLDILGGVLGDRRRIAQPLKMEHSHDRVALKDAFLG